jgi:hypothetical protein
MLSIGETLQHKFHLIRIFGFHLREHNCIQWHKEGSTYCLMTSCCNGVKSNQIETSQECYRDSPYPGIHLALTFQNYFRFSFLILTFCFGFYYSHKPIVREVTCNYNKYFSFLITCSLGSIWYCWTLLYNVPFD